MSVRILYIDDEEDLLELAAAFLEEEGLPVHTSADFDDALSLVRATSYDLIISDINMPKGSVQEFLDTARNEGLFDGKCILVSGNVEGNLPPVDLVLQKPISFDELVVSIRQLLSL